MTAGRSYEDTVRRLNPYLWVPALSTGARNIGLRGGAATMSRTGISNSQSLLHNAFAHGNSRLHGTDLDGVNDYYRVPWTALTGAPALTICGFIYSGTSVDQRVFGWGDSSSSGRKIHFRIDSSSGYRARLEVQGDYLVWDKVLNDGVPRWFAIVLSGSTLNGASLYLGSTRARDAATIEAPSRYANGGLSVAINLAASDLLIGAANQTTVENFVAGTMGPFVIFNYAMSGWAVTKLFYEALNVPDGQVPSGLLRAA